MGRSELGAGAIAEARTWHELRRVVSFCYSRFVRKRLNHYKLHNLLMLSQDMESDYHCEGVKNEQGAGTENIGWSATSSY